MNMNNLITFLSSLLLLGCTSEVAELPILGEKLTDPISGEVIHYHAPSFELTNQLNQTISNQQFEGKIQVIDFFFTSCPTICPQMTSHLKLVQESFLEQKKLAIISYSIDTKYDTPARLLSYAKRYNIDNDKWSLLTGDKNVIFELAKDYKVKAFDDSIPGSEYNLIHDGTFVLVDGQGHIRGYYNGLELEDTQRLISDIRKLLK